MDYRLTGKTRIRVTRMRQRLVLQVQERETFYDHLWRWRDATMTDVQELGEAEALIPILRQIQAVKG